MANRFSNEGDLHRIDLGDGDWIDIPNIVSHDDAKIFKESQDDCVVAKTIIKAWNLKDVNGKEAEINEQNIRRLDIRITQRVIREMISKMTLPKAPSSESEKPSEADTDAKS